MRLNERQFKEVAEAIANSRELKGTVQVDVSALLFFEHELNELNELWR